MDNNLLEGSVFKKIIKFIIPIILALFLQAAYGAVDLIVVGQFGTVMDISGVSTGSQIMHNVTMVITCFATGTTILIGTKIGQNNKDDADKVIGTSILLFSIIALSVTIIMLILSKPFCKLMQAPEEAFNETLSYVRICFIGFIFIVFYNLLGSICRGLGDSKTPLITVIISAILNVLLDLLFCAVFNMGSSGAALATIISQGVSVISTILLIKFKKDSKFVLTIKKENIKFFKELDIKIVKLGAPLALQELLVGGSFLVITAIVNNIGLVESAGIGVAQKLCSFIMLIPSAFSQAISAFVAQNIGANQYNRAKKSLFIGIISSLICACFLFYLSFFNGEILARIFSKDADVNYQAANYLKSYAIDTFLTSFLFCFIGFLNGMGRTKLVMVQGIIGAFCVRIPVSFIMSALPNTTLFLIGLATPSSTVVQIIICVIAYFIINKKYITQNLNNNFQLTDE